MFLINNLKLKIMNIGDKITVNSGRVCTTFPLEDFKYYMGEKRNNNIKSGVIIQAKRFVGNSMCSLLVKDINTDEVCVVRTYDNDYNGKIDS